MDPEGRTVKISSGKRSAACEEWMRNRRICGKLTIDTAVFIYKAKIRLDYYITEKW